MAPSRAPTKYVRFEHGGHVAYGIWENDVVKELAGDIFTESTLTGRAFPAAETRFLIPCEPSKVLAVGLNYASHRLHVERSEGVLMNASGRPAPPDHPCVFAKFPTSLIADGQEIVLPGDATNVHFEGEMALVIGRKAKHVFVDDAPRYVFGVTIGNDLVDREWLLNDLQWFRAKGADTFGPIGPAIVTGLDYGHLRLQTSRPRSPTWVTTPRTPSPWTCPTSRIRPSGRRWRSTGCTWPSSRSGRRAACRSS